MAAAAMKHMASNFAKLDKFERVDFRRWQKKMHLLLTSMSVVCMLTTPIPEDGENATMEHIRRRNKWENEDYVYRGLIRNGIMSVVCMLTTPIPEDGENATMEHIRRRNKWENEDYVCRGLIRNGMSDPLFDIYQNVESSKEL
ncbi:hypothetical protein Tco_1559129 [Tanacetum coccineum]